MSFLVPAAAGAFAAVPVILLMYFLKARGPEVCVGSVFLWARKVADRQANMPWKRLRLSKLLLVQLLLAAAVAAALMRPGLVGASGVASTTVVLIDGSPSMLATDVQPSRFQAAVSRARRLAGQLGSGRRLAVVVLGEHARLLTPATGDTRALNDALDKARPGGKAADLQEGFSVANAILAGQPGGSIVLLSDGHFEPPPPGIGVAAPLTYQSIGASGENVAIEAIGRTAEGDVFLRVANFGPSARDLRVQLRADGRVADVLSVQVPEGSSAQPVWSRLDPATKVLEARLVPGDEFALDDRAWLVTQAPTAKRVLVVTSENGFLTRALALRPDLELTVVKPADYRPGLFDLSVFDGFVPPGPLPEPSLLIAPPEGQGPLPVGPVTDAGEVLPPDPREPLLQYVSLRDVHVQSASSLTVPEGWRTVIAATTGPLLLVREGDGRVAQLNFDIHRSDLPVRPAFPILVQNLVSHLLPDDIETRVQALGEPVQLAGGPEVSSLEISAPDGRRLTLAPPFPVTVSDTLAPGVYDVRATSPAGDSLSRFVVQLKDPRQSAIAPGERPVVRTAARRDGDAPRGTIEIWPWLVALAIVALTVEWMVFLRG